MLLIYNVCYRLFFALKRFRRWKWLGVLQKPVRRLYDWYAYYFGLFLNRKLVLWMDKHPVKCGVNTKSRKERYTVSLTSFPARIEYVHIAIDTLMRQRFKPDRIVLWLADSQFPGRALPEKLRVLENKGLTIRFCDDLRSHKKYFYTFQEYPNDHVILADDDLFYAPDTIAKLVRMHKKYPEDIIALSAQIIGPQMSDLPSVWPAVENGKRYAHSMAAQAFTGAGSLFPAKWYPKEICNKEKAMALAGTADDLWLKAMSILSNVKTTVIYPVRGFPVEVTIPHNQTLFQVNGTQGESINDKTWRALVEVYNLR